MLAVNDDQLNANNIMLMNSEIKKIPNRKADLELQ
jgi:hypothetical protein